MKITYISPCLDSCYSDDTEVLTQKGFKYFKELTSEDKLATLNKNHYIEYHYPVRLIKKKYKGEMIRVFNDRSGIDLLVTPDHSMYVSDDYERKNNKPWYFEKAYESYGKHRVYKRDANYNNKGLKTIDLPNGICVNAKHWLRFLGYFLSKGSVVITKKKDYNLQIRQNTDSPYYQKMAEAMSQITENKVNTNQENRIITDDKQLVLYLKKLGNKYHKYIEREILDNASKEELEILFEALMESDDHFGNTGGDIYSTSSKFLRDDFQELLLKIGYSGSYKKAFSKNDKRFIDDREHIVKENHWDIHIKRTQHEVPISNCEDKTNSYFTENYDGYVYCATVPNHTLFIRRNGHTVWSGNSGYAEAARHNIAALHHVGVDVGVVPISFEHQKCDLGKLGGIVRGLIRKKTQGKIHILHATPQNYPKLVQKNIYNIGYAAWETSRLPEDWVGLINILDEIWVPSEYNVQVFKNSGVNIPVIRIPHTFNPDMNSSVGELTVLENASKNEFIFYSIFQWLKRKNPLGLLVAYLSEFTPQDNVSLVLKTFNLQPGNPTDKDFIKKEIQRIKQHMYLPEYPRILLISSLLSREQMLGLHKQCDCYISLHHSEGFGIPLAEAMLAGNPVITTNYGGTTDFLTKETGFPINYMETPVYGMPWETYRSNQCWADPDLMHARKVMREVYNSREKAKAKGVAGCSWIKENLSWTTVGSMMKNRLEEIERNL